MQSIECVINSFRIDIFIVISIEVNLLINL